MNKLSDLSAPPLQPLLKPSRWTRAVYAALWVVGTVWLVMILAWSTLNMFIVPRIGDYRELLQTQASRAMGMPVKIGHISAEGGWWVPMFDIQDLQVLDAQGREALKLSHVQVAISPRSLVRGQFEQLTIDRPELDIRRDSAGHVWVAGIDTGASAGDGSGADWFFSQPEFLLRDGVVRWRDELRFGEQAPELVMSDVELVMQNHWLHHDVRLDATPPSELGQRFSLRGKFKQAPWQRAGDVAHWRGELFADAPHLDLSTLRQWLAMDPDRSLQEGRGALRLWADVVNAQLVGVNADMALDEVKASLGANLQPLALRHVHGRLGAKWQGDEVSLNSEDLVFDTQDGQHWPGGVLRVQWKTDDAATGSISADRLDLNALAQISQRLPLPDTARGLLARVQPQGQVNQLNATWRRATTLKGATQLDYTARGTVQQFSLNRDSVADSPLAALPGVQAAQLEFDVTQRGGKAKLHIQDGSLTLPMGLDEPRIALEDASAQLVWELDGDQVQVKFTQGHVSNPDVAGDFSGSWKTGVGNARLPGVLDLTANLSRAQVAQVYRYLPSNLSASVRGYVHEAVKAGDASNVKLRLRGNLADMPFDNPKLGEFRISAQIAQGQYAYVPAKLGTPLAQQWPGLTALNGELVFERSALHFKGQTQLTGAPKVMWRKVEAHIPNLAKAVVSVSGEARGPLPEVLAMVSQSALNELTGQVLSQSQASGDADYKLSLSVPLDTLNKTKVQGSVAFTDNELQVMPGIPVLSRTRGMLQFSERGLSLKNLRARALGGDAQIDGGLSFEAAAGESPLQLKINGNLTAEGLRQARELGFASRLAQRATGGSSYIATVGLRRGQPELLINSDLRGMALNLPAPMTKVPATTLPLRVEMQLTRESLAPKARVLQDQIKVSVGRVLALAYVRDLSGPRTRVLRGGVAVGADVVDGLTPRDSGVGLNLQLPFVDLDAWNQALTQFTGAPLVNAAGKPAKAAVVGQEAAASDDAQDYVPHVVVLRADQIKVAERAIHHVLVGGTRVGEVWRVNLSADELNGSAEVRPANGNTPAQLFARLAYLNIPPSLVPDVENLLTEEPSSIPALDIVVNELTLRGKKLGRLEIEAVNRMGANAAREWRLNKLNLILPEATFNANGSWMADGPRLQRTRLNVLLDVRNSGELLTRFGTPDAIRDGRGRLEGQVSWQGSPITLDYASMAGKLNLNIEKGQFLKTDPGAARLLGVLNLQALPRRLTLDFSDVFSEGFAFDFVRGDVRIEQGVAFTNNLQMKGVVAGALLEGSADLARETQDLKVVVVPEINAGTASLYMATINPVIGLTSYLAQLILSRPLVRAGTSEFHIDGTWANPRVTKVD
nr:YhdP family protein [uncultured Limnohabitans sp.]